MPKFPITPDGFRSAQAELKKLTSVDRPEIIQAIAEARAHGDLSENAEYTAARERQGFIERRISDLERMLAQAEVIDPSTLSGEHVTFGAHVTVRDHETGKENTYQIVGDYESDLEKHKLSISSPIGRALIGKEVGDIAEVRLPAGMRDFEVLNVSFG